MGGQIDADLTRLEAIAAVLDRSAEPYFVSLDGNEQYADARGRRRTGGAASAPAPALRGCGTRSSSSSSRSPASWRCRPTCARADLGKPVIIDESDGELDTFVQARARGYAGVSSKTCKGLYKSILNAARCAAWNARGRRGRATSCRPKT